MQMYSSPPLQRPTLHPIDLESGALDKVIKVPRIHYFNAMSVLFSLSICIIQWPIQMSLSQESQLPSIKVLRQINKNIPSTSVEINKHLNDIYLLFADSQTSNTMSWSLPLRSWSSISE